MPDNVLPFEAGRRDVLCEVGGPIDETAVSLCIYGEKLDPDDISNRLGTTATTSFSKGFRKSAKSPPAKRGGWFLEMRGKPPADPETLTAELLSRVTTDCSVWRELSANYDVQIRYGIFLDAWNRGFDLSADLVSKVAATGAAIVFDIYANLDDES